MKVKTILPVLCICIFLLTISCKNETPEKTTSFLDGLTEISQNEWDNYGDEMESIKFYGTEGKEISDEQLQNYFSEGATPKIYKDEQGKLALGVISPPTAEEKKAMQEIMSQFEAQEAKLQESVGKPLPDFNLIDYEGNPVTVADLKGKVTVVNFWFKECKPCIREMPELNELVTHYKDNAKVQFLGFSLTEKDKLVSFFKKHTFDYRIIPDSGAYATINGLTGYPTNMVIDDEGNIAFLKTAFIPGIAGTIKKEIERLL